MYPALPDLSFKKKFVDEEGVIWEVNGVTDDPNFKLREFIKVVEIEQPIKEL